MADIVRLTLSTCWSFLFDFKFHFDNIEFCFFDVLVVGVVLGIACSLIGIFLDWRKS